MEEDVGRGCPEPKSFGAKREFRAVRASRRPSRGAGKLLETTCVSLPVGAWSYDPSLLVLPPFRAPEPLWLVTAMMHGTDRTASVPAERPVGGIGE